MYIDYWTIIILFLLVSLAIGTGVKFLIRPTLEKKAREESDELHTEVLELRKKVGAIAGAQKILETIEHERTQNVAVMKTRALIMNYTRWEKPSRQIRSLLSLGTALTITLVFFYFIRDVREVENIDFWAIGILMFALAYFFWGSVLETYWKQKQLHLMRVEFLKILRLSTNPLAARDDLYKWMNDNQDVADPVKKMLEGLFDKWLRQNLKME